MTKRATDSSDATALSPAHLEAIERMKEEVGWQPSPVADEYVGKSPAQIEELEAAADKHDEILENQSTAALRRRVILLEEQLAENTVMMKKLAEDRGGYAAVPQAVLEFEAEKQRRLTYERIRRNGGVCTIVIHTHEDINQNWDVLLAVNGIGMYIQRGESTVIPVEYLEVLDHARTKGTIPEVDDHGNRVYRHFDRLSYPYSLLDYSGQRLPAAA